MSTDDPVCHDPALGPEPEPPRHAEPRRDEPQQNGRGRGVSRRQMLSGLGVAPLLGSAAAGLVLNISLGGCVATGGPSGVDAVWGRRGLSDGRFLKPRAITIDPLDQLYIVDTTGRIQVFDADGNHQRTWRVPDTANGRPTGLAFDVHGAVDVHAEVDVQKKVDVRGQVDGTGPAAATRLLVADTHYYRMLVFSPEGVLQPTQQIGGARGSADGEFAFVTDAVSDSLGQIYIGEYGASDRIQKFSADGEFIASWGGTGDAPGRFLRPQSLVVDGQTLWIADACNHRIVRYDLNHEKPELVSCWGVEGTGPGKLHYPYDLAIDRDGTVVVCEYGNQRLQRFTADGELLAIWGSPGHAPGQLYQPWGVVIDSLGRVHVLDSNNHRVQRVLNF